ncbi:coiled-coil domain-containing protein 30-like [Nyctibius grandis]|uniref:coiled-coil domain-containing protein 30-like n=1 Tax=Nyctibius grandis TaxID=48427 RepID=UPI0035BC0D54
MKKIWRCLRRRGAQDGPVASGSNGGHELQPEGRGELRLEGIGVIKNSGGEAGNIRAQIPMAGSDSSPSHLGAGSRQPSESINLQSEAEQWLRAPVMLNEDRIAMRETNERFSQWMSKGKKQAGRLGGEVEQLKKALRKKTWALAMAERELRQTQREAEEQHALHLEKDQERKDAIEKAKELQEQLAQLQMENLSLHQQLEDTQKKNAQAQTSLSDERFQQQEEKVQQLCGSAERELRYEREKNVDLQKQNLLLQQECTKQKLKDSQHQLLLAEACVSDKKLLEQGLKEAQENEARVQQELHEEQLKRKPLEQQLEELRQQLRHSRETEASLAKMHMELQAKTLHVLEDERKTDSSECQKENQKLSQQLSLLKEENKALYEEGVRLLNEKHLYVRKYSETQLRHKEKIRRAKEIFIHEVKQRDSRIKQLENELSKSKLQMEKGEMLIAQITAENEKLLQETRQLLQKVTDQEETLWSNRSMIATLQSRVKILDEENVRLHESKLQLSVHVPTLQCVPRSIRAPNMQVRL